MSDEFNPRGGSLTLQLRRHPAPLELYDVGQGPSDPGPAGSARKQTRLIAELLHAVSEGMPVTQACALTGLRYSTVASWCKERGAGYWPDFHAALKKARGISVRRHIRKINRTSDWKASAFWLERNVQEFQPKAVIEAIETDEARAAREIAFDEDFLNELSAAYDAYNGNSKATKKNPNS